MGTGDYHHGDLRRALLDVAVEVIAEVGAAGVSLRELARRVGVSHAAPAHHFADKRGLLTAVAVEGYDRLADTLATASGDLLAMGVAYVRFAVTYPAHFAVMFTPTLYHRDDPAVLAASDRTRALLHEAVGATQPSTVDIEYTAVAAWSIVHGFATLWSAGALPTGLGTELDVATRSVIRLLLDADPAPRRST